MGLHELMERGGHRRLIAVVDRDSGLRAWIALHHLDRGPAIGGIRIWTYRNEAEAVADALRLARAMTYKCVLAGVQGGGGKTVVHADALRDRAAAMRRLGEEIEALGGVYHAGPDVGFGPADAFEVERATRHLACFGGGHSGLRPAGEATAEGALWGIRAGLESLGVTDLAGITVAVQGLGAVGCALARRLLEAGARVVAADPDPAAAAAGERLGVELVEPEALPDVPCEVWAPCALGGSLHDLTISRLRTRVVAALANNALSRDDQAVQLARRGILYLPDFVLNAGALIEGEGHARTGRTDWSRELRRIGDTTRRVLERAARDGVPPLAAARTMAEEVLAAEAASRSPVS